MKYISPKEAAQHWDVSERMVCKYCMQGRIADAYQKAGIWYIPENAVKPTRKVKEEVQPPKLLLKLCKQRDSGKYSGLYDYLQINMAYSNNRMASNRLTRQQMEVLFKADKIFTVNEAMKVNDIIEARNQFICIDYVLNEAMRPLTQAFVQKLYTMMHGDCCGHRRKALHEDGYRKMEASSKYGETTSPKEIDKALGDLFRKYEAQKEIGLHEILDMHVRFERIRPYEDFNGRIGRLLMLKECLRHGITPFAIDDKRRNRYLEGIRCWDENDAVLVEVCEEAQRRFEVQTELQKLMERQAK